MKANTLEGLRQAFANQIIPLLQEYFFDDLSKVALTLSGHKGVSSFVTRETLRHEQLFPDALRSVGSGVRERFVVTNSATWAQGDFVAIYAAPVQPAGGETAETT
jgi:5-methylcytosine-specific restriction protein B